jgi:hypothetical protein
MSTQMAVKNHQVQKEEAAVQAAAVQVTPSIPKSSRLVVGLAKKKKENERKKRKAVEGL